MINARKNISSLWKAKKGRLSGTRRKRQNAKERSWRNSARERRFSFLRRRKETELSDKDVYEMLGTLEFVFAHEKHTIAEAKLLFVQEIQFGIGGAEVIALSETFGTIIFTIPEKMVQKINQRVITLPLSFKDYLCILIERAAILAQALDGWGKFGITCQVAAEAMSELAKLAVDSKKAGKLAAAFPSNNWLKLHGRPMRRKRKGKRI